MAAAVSDHITPSRSSRGPATAAALAVVAALAHLLLESSQSASSENAAAHEHDDDHDVILFTTDGEPSDTSPWLSSWFGVYKNDSIPVGRAVLTMRHDRVLWYSGDRGYWHFGHPQDVAVGAAMIASEDMHVAAPTRVVMWRAVAPANSFISEPTLRCVRAPPRILTLSGYAPARWVADWLGVYERRDEADQRINGYPSYGRRDCSGSSSSRCHAQRMWFTAAHGAPAWVLGDAATAGLERAYVLAVPGRFPHSKARAWTMADEYGGWRPAAALRCTVRAAEVIGWHRGWAEEVIARFAPPPPQAAVTVEGRRAHPRRDDADGDAAGDADTEEEAGATEKDEGAVDGAESAATATADGASGFEAAGDAAIGGRWREQLAKAGASLLRALADLLDALSHRSERLRAWLAATAAMQLPLPEAFVPALRAAGSLLGAAQHEVASRLQHATQHLGDLIESLQPIEACMLTSAVWTVILLLGGALHSWRQQRLQEMADEAEGEVEADTTPESSEEKRLAFACLSGAIEETKPHISEQQYLALYSAAVWCFNLTPYWAGTVPRPPSPRPSREEPVEGIPVANSAVASPQPPAENAPSAVAAARTDDDGQDDARVVVVARENAPAAADRGCGAGDTGCVLREE